MAIALDDDGRETIRPMVGTPGAAVTLEALVEDPVPVLEPEIAGEDAVPEEPAEPVIAGDLALPSTAEQYEAREHALRQLELDRLLKR